MTSRDELFEDIRSRGAQNGLRANTVFSDATAVGQHMFNCDRRPCYVRPDTIFTVNASTVTLKKKDTTPCAVVSRRIALLVI